MDDKGYEIRAGIKGGAPLIGALCLCAVLASRFLGQSVGERALVLGLAAGVVVAVVGAVLAQRSVARTLSALREQQKELEQLRAEFVQNVTHELRQPLTLVRGYIELLAREQVDEKMQQELVDRALARTLELAERVEAITTFHHLPQRSLQLSLTDLTDLVDTALKMVWQKAFRAGVTFCLEHPSHLILVKADSLWLLEAMKQLLENAIRFSPEGAVISVRLFATEDQAGIEIADQGTGIPVTELDRAFVPFHRSDWSTPRRIGSMEVGLTIAREIVEAHGGSLRAESGGTLILSLPLRGAGNLETRGNLSARLRTMALYV
jgi:signal transduction histidine kinase